MTERSKHINIPMAEYASSNGATGGQGANVKSPHGSTVSFHNIHYSVDLKSGPVCKRKVTTKEILVDLKFLDVLAARKDPSGLSGEVLIDGAPQPPNFKCLSGYVVQDDVVMGTLTVRENFRFSAALRLPTSVSEREKEEKVNNLIKQLGLTKVADSKVGTQMIRGISGGERKRTNIGMELIIDPSVLFLDEPTTGLDASTANSVLLLLKRYSIYRLFDSLTLLVSGKQVYHGPAQDALDYFANIGYACEAHNNPADFFLDVINGDSTAVAFSKMQNSEEPDFEEKGKNRQSIEDRLVEEYRKCENYRNTQAELERIVKGKDHTTRPKSRTITYNTSFAHQFKWVLKRTFRNLMLNPQTSVAQVAVTVFLALIVGAIFFGVKDDQSGMQNRMGALFFITTNQCFGSLHEYISGYYRVSVYFLSKILSDIITLRTIPAIVFSCVAYFMIGFKATVSAFFIFMVSVALVAYTATAMTMAISADQTVVAVANIFMTISFVFMMIFSGLLVNLPSIMDWLAWFQYLSIPRYGLTALQINEFVGLKFCENLPVRPTMLPGINCTIEAPVVKERSEHKASPMKYTVDIILKSESRHPFSPEPSMATKV
ncbi:hypothetical protein JZ751_006010 [Albula glossodonta]|uniref:ABC transporter domain-containing protein n=1 Tax=Albula glossodonta TaxID=121402 RepID=A0A8T2P123_9TELE|nr:hypothetical protein JZ751_006010 [Albula glossodonta]